ncbi:MAG: hypothetical protein EBV84_14455 [Betaproteobacteria bacterium]|nr:hypothetical protein [Betaproteobacteria bacterium]
MDGGFGGEGKADRAGFRARTETQQESRGLGRVGEDGVAGHFLREGIEGAENGAFHRAHPGEAEFAPDHQRVAPKGDG